MRPPRSRREPVPKSPREVALEALYAVDRRHAFSDRLLHKLLKDNVMEPRDAALVTSIVRGTTRMRGRIDAILDHYVKIGLDSLPPWIQNILRMGVFQLLYLDKVPDRAAVDESVSLARKFGHPGTAGLVNAVLRKISAERDHLPEPKIGDDPAAALASLYSHPEWMVRRWLRRFDLDDTRALLEANNTPPPVTIRVNRLREKPGAFLQRLLEAGLDAEPGIYHDGSIRIRGDFNPAVQPGFNEGLFVVQDESESLVVDLLAPEPGEFVVDLCGAPGGKSSHIAEKLGARGLVVSVEIQRGRLKPLKENKTRLGLANMHIVLGDGATVAFTRVPDRVLIDAPCSGLGVLAKRADARWRKTEASIRQVVEFQDRLVRAAAELVRPGGIVVYSVCSIEPEEGPKVIERLLKEHPNLELQDAAEYVSPVLVHDRMMVTLPHRDGMDGVFAARFRRKS